MKTIRLGSRIGMSVVVVLILLFSFGCTSDDNEDTTNSNQKKEYSNKIASTNIEEDYLTANELTDGLYIKRGNKFCEIVECDYPRQDFYQSFYINNQVYFGDGTQQLVMDKFENIIETLEKDDTIVKVSSSGSPPVSQKLLWLDISDEYVVDNGFKIYLTDGENLDYNNVDMAYFGAVAEINNSSDLSLFNYIYADGNYHLVGEKGEKYTVSQNAGTQGLESEEFYATAKIVTCTKKSQENPMVVNYNSPTDGYASMDLTNVPPGYYAFNSKEIIVHITD